MATLKELLLKDLQTAEENASKLRATIEALPQEVALLSEEAWTHIKGLFGINPPSPPPPPAAPAQE